jgi:transaldolase
MDSECLRRRHTGQITLCFSQRQAAAVYAATKGSRAPVYVSPFVGRLDDVGQNGVDLVRNINRMFDLPARN